MADSDVAPSDDTPGKSGFWITMILAIIVIAPRLLMLGESAYYDEVWTLEVMDAPSFAEFWKRQAVNDPPTTLVPVYFSLQYFWSTVFSSSVLAARALSLILTCTAAIVFYRLARRIAGAASARWGLLLYAVSSVHVYYSVEIRMYPLVLLLSLLSVTSLFRVLESPSRARWAAHVSVNVLLTFTHLISTPLFVVQWVYLILCRRDLKRTIVVWTGTHVTLLIGLLLWLKLMWSSDVSDVALWVPEPSIRQIVNAFVVYVGGRPTNWDISAYLPFGISFDLVLLGMYAGCVIAALLSAKGKFVNDDYPAMGVYFLAAWVIIPTFLLLSLSYFVVPFFLYRYILACSLPLVMLAGIGLDSIPNVRIRYAAGGLMVVLHCYQLLVLREPIRPDYAGVGADIRAHAAESDRVIAFKDYNAEALVFNSDFREDEVVAVKHWTELFDALTRARAEHSDTWVIFWRWDDLPTFEDALNGEGYTYDVQTYGGVPRMSVYRVWSGDGASLQD